MSKPLLLLCLFVLVFVFGGVEYCMQGRRSLKPHLESPLDRTPRVRKILESIDSHSIMDHSSSSSLGSMHDFNLKMPNLMQMMDIFFKKKQDDFEKNKRRLTQLEIQRGILSREPLKREYYNPNLSMDHDKFHSQSSSYYENHSFNSYHPRYEDVKNETSAMKQIPCFLRNDSIYYPSHPPNYALPNDSNLEAFQIPNEPYLKPSDHLSGDDESCLENLIFKHTLEENDVFLENPSLDDPLDFDLKKNWDETRYIFEDIPMLSLENPSFGRELISSSFQVLHDSSFQVPFLVSWVVDCELSFSESNFEFDSYFLVAANPLPFALFKLVL